MNQRTSILLLVIISAATLSSISLNQSPTTDSVVVYYFYENGCSFCAETDILLTTLASQYDIELHSFEIIQNSSNLELINHFFDGFGIPINQRGIPAIIIGDTLLLGLQQIEQNLENLIQVTEPGIYPVPRDPIDPPGIPDLPVLLIIITGAGIADSFNPCALAVLIFLLTTLLQTGDKRKVLLSGLAFSASLYLGYFLFGVGLFSFVLFSGVSLIFYQIMGFISIILGVLNLRKGIWRESSGILTEIPSRWQPTIQRLLSQVTNPAGAFLLGFLICFVELPCTGGPYLLVLAMLADRTTLLFALPLLLYYNFLFILPMILLTILVAKGYATPSNAQNWRVRHRPTLHLIMGLILIIIGGLMVLGFF